MKNWSKQLGCAASLCAVSMLAGCGNFGSGFFQNPNAPTGSTTSGGDYIYSVNSDSTFSAFEVASGALTAIAGNPIAPGSAFSVAVSRPDTYVYVGGAGAIYCYSIGPTGGLTGVGASNYIVGSQSYLQMDTSPNGQYLVALSQSTGTVPELSVFSIDPTTGILTLDVNSALPIASTATLINSSIRVSPNSAFIGIALGASGDFIYQLGTAAPYLGSYQAIVPPASSEDDALLFDPTDSYVYVARYGLSAGSGTLVPYGLTAAGVPTQLKPVASGNAVKSLLLNKDGTQLYTADFADGKISGYAVASGVLTPLPGSPFVGSTGVTSLALDNTGAYVIAAANGGTGSTDLTLYQFDALNATQLDALATYGNGSNTQGSTSIAVAATY